MHMQCNRTKRAPGNCGTHGAAKYVHGVGLFAVIVHVAASTTAVVNEESSWVRASNDLPIIINSSIL